MCTSAHLRQTSLTLLGGNTNERKSVGRAKSSLRHSATSKWRVIFTTFAVTFDTNIMWLCPKLLCPGLTDSLIYIFMPASVDASKVWWEQVIKALFFAKLIVVIKDCGDRGRRRSAPSMHHFFAACSSLSRDARISSRHLLHQSHLHALQRKLLSCTLNWDYTLLAATHSWWSWAQFSRCHKYTDCERWMARQSVGLAPSFPSLINKNSGYFSSLLGTTTP